MNAVENYSIATRTQSIHCTGWIMPFGEFIEASAGHLMVAVAPTSTARDEAVNRLRSRAFSRACTILASRISTPSSTGALNLCQSLANL